MSSDAANRGPFTVEEADQEDHAWVLDVLARGAWEALSPARAAGVSEATVRQSLDAEVASLHGAQAPPNQVFVARDASGKPAGCIWLVASLMGYDRQPGVFVLGIHVDEDCRDGDVGRRLVEQAETWARAGGVAGLEVLAPAHGFPPIEQWRAWGFDMEKVQLTKVVPSAAPESPA